MPLSMSLKSGGASLHKMNCAGKLAGLNARPPPFGLRLRLRLAEIESHARRRAIFTCRINAFKAFGMSNCRSLVASSWAPAASCVFCQDAAKAWARRN